MILVDTSIWIDHLHHGDQAMFDLLDRGSVVLHPFVQLEIALGSLRDRSLILAMLERLPTTSVASNDEVLTLMEAHRLFASGLGLTDVHLMASALIDSDVLIWTRDRRLRAAAERLGVAYSPE